ncbi:MAG TPA: peptidoglycan DD-metalloendopeptidase family protein [Burkholderiales bacterium]|nr:peptidoglycan DD-metalloendopeptidase family protein [Burkholderiales bacterium]
MRRSTVALALAAMFLAACAGPRIAAPVFDRKPPRASAPPARAPAAAPAATPAPGAPDGFYVVRRGDTLYSIALENGADYRDVAQWNGLEDPTKISVGQLLRVTPPEAPRTQVGAAPGPARIEARALEPAAPVASAPSPQAASIPPAPAERVASSEPKAVSRVEGDVGGFVWPAKGKVIAGFSEPRNKGIDIDGKLGDPVVAAAAGRVTYIGSGIPGLGKLVVIKHDNGFITVYAHNRDILVKEQQSVARGQKIAELGSTDADRPKLHFQIRKGSAPVDPMRYLPGL